MARTIVEIWGSKKNKAKGIKISVLFGKQIVKGCDAIRLEIYDETINPSYSDVYYLKDSEAAYIASGLARAIAVRLRGKTS